MNENFSRVLSLLRQEKGVSQRAAAAELGISQALLSHYEKGIREPGLNFVARACDYYHVSADYLLGRTLTRDGAVIEAEELVDASEAKESLKGSIMAKLQKKLLVNAVSMYFDLLGRTGSREAVARRAPISPPPCTSCTGPSTGRRGARTATSPWTERASTWTC